MIGVSTQPGAARGREDLGELGAVAAQQRDAVAGAQAARAQRTHQPVGARVQLGERAAAVVADQRERVGHHLGPYPERHARQHRGQ